MTTSSGDQTFVLAKVVERWLGNPLSRRIIGFCTHRCDKCGRRIELALRRYVGEEVGLCYECSIASRIVGKLLDLVAKKIKIPKEEIQEHIKDFVWRKGLSSVLEGIARYGVQKPFTSYSPFLVVWNFTKGCNLNCKHCYEDAKTPAPDELNRSEALAAVDAMGEAGVAFIALSGGEPLTRPDMFDVAQRIKENEIGFAIATNGTMLTRENVKRLSEVACQYIQVSLDGATPATHNRFRGGDSFEKTVRGIRNAVESGIKVGVTTCITKENIHEIGAIIDLVESLGAQIFMHYNFIPTGRGKEIIDLDISPDEREKLLESLVSQISTRKISLLSTAPQYSRVCSGLGVLSLTHYDTFGQTELGEKASFLAEFVGGCGAGRLYIALEPNGDITPCVFIPITLGNIKHDNLLEVWENHPQLKALRDRKSFWGNCGKCEHQNICGGCRARAYAYYHDLTAPDPGCLNNLEYWELLQAGETVETGAVQGEKGRAEI